MKCLQNSNICLQIFSYNVTDSSLNMFTKLMSVTFLQNSHICLQTSVYWVMVIATLLEHFTDIKLALTGFICVP